MGAEEYRQKSRSYEYSIRHLYGLEGKMKAFSPQSCRKIAQGWGNGEGGGAHGCPFHSLPIMGTDASNGYFRGEFGSGSGVVEMGNGGLQQLLHRTGMGVGDIEDIVGPLRAARVAGSVTKDSSSDEARAACRRHLMVVHRGKVGKAEMAEVGASPNDWLMASVEAHSKLWMTQEG
ncbi:unnamed protein product [Choristocarpus tenellus]